MASNTTVPATRATTTAWSVRLTTLVGWILISLGVGVLLYLAYALLFTNIGAQRAQADLRDQWQQAQQVPAVPERRGTDAEPVALPAGRAVALVEFVRPGSATALMHDGPLVVLDDVSTAALAKGPGHYPGTALPGRPGNFSIAGHRTTYGGPFLHLDALRSGDQIQVTSRRGTQYTYEVTEKHVVSPSDQWVIGEDPLGTGEPTMTLTTCHPRFSAAKRLVVHAELVS